MSLLRSTFFLISAEIIFALSGYFIQAILGRLLGPEEYGRYSLVIGFTTMIIIFVGRGIPTAMAKRISEYTTNQKRVFAIKRTAMHWQYSIITIATIIFYLCASLIAQIFDDQTLTPLFQLSAFIVPMFALSSFHVLYFNGLKRFGAMTALKMARGLFRLGWIVGLAYFFHITGAIIGAIIAPLSVFILALIIDYFLQKKELTLDDNDTHNKISSYPIRKLLTYAGSFMLFLLLYEFFVRADIYMIKFIVGNDTSVGLYNAAMTIALIPYYLLYALALVLFPTISTLTAKSNHHATQLLSTILRLLFVIIVPIGLLMTIFAQPLIQLLFGPQFVASASLIPLMMGGTIFGTLFYICAAVFNGAGYTRIPVAILFVAIFCSITANTIFMPQYGIMATAIIFSATSTFMGVVSLFFIHRIFSASISSLTLIRTSIASLIIIFCAHWVPATLFYMLLGGTGLFIIYILILFGLKELHIHDISYITHNK